MFRTLKPIALTLAALTLAAGAPALAQAQTPAGQAAAPASDSRPLIDGRFTVEVVGHGPDVILIPGLASSRDTYADFVRQDAGRHRLHLIQLAGFAGTPAGQNRDDAHMISDSADAIAAYIQARHLRRPAIVGHSLGGLTALAIAERHPQLISRAEIVDSFPFYALVISPQATVEQAASFAGPARDQMLQVTSDAARRQAAGQLAAAMATSPANQQQIAQWSVSSDPGVVARAFYEDMTTDLRPELSKIGVPVKVLYAYNSYIAAQSTPEQYDQRLAAMYAGLKGVKLVRIDDSRHFISLDQPARFASETEAFLDGR